MQLKILPFSLAIYRLCVESDIPATVFQQPFYSITHTAEEISIVVPDILVLPDIPVENGWNGIQIIGPLDFGLIGVIARISKILAAAQISLFVLSTYDTDYFLVKQEKLAKSRMVLEAAGYEFLVTE